jgi:hypothetical protein
MGLMDNILRLFSLIFICFEGFLKLGGERRFLLILILLLLLTPPDLAPKQVWGRLFGKRGGN